MRRALAAFAAFLALSFAGPTLGAAYYTARPDVASMQALGPASPTTALVTVKNVGNFYWGGACVPSAPATYAAAGVSSSVGCWYAETSASLGATLPPPFARLSGYGDSITEDGLGPNATSWLQQFGLLQGRATANYGVGGQPSGSIAVRMNAFAGTANQQFTTGFSIPTSGTVAVTFTSGFAPCFNTTTDLAFIVSAVTYTGHCTDDGSHVYNFTPDTYPVSPVVVAINTPFTVPVGDSLQACVAIDMGRNDFGNPAQVQASITASVNAVVAAQTGAGTPSCYVVQQILKGENEPSGSPDAIAIDALNAWMLATFPSNVVASNDDLVEDYDPNNAADVLDHGNLVVPYSLRAQDLEGVLSAAITTTGQTSIQTDVCVAKGFILTVGTEWIKATTDCTGSGPFTSTYTRGYAGTTAATYIIGTAWTGVDPLHPGWNATTPANDNCPVSGNQCYAQSVNGYFQAIASSPFVSTNSMFNALANFYQEGSQPLFDTVRISRFSSPITLTAVGNGGWQFLSSVDGEALYGCDLNNSCLTNIGDGVFSGWGSASFNGVVSGSRFSIYDQGYHGTLLLDLNQFTGLCWQAPVACINQNVAGSFSVGAGLIAANDNAYDLGTNVVQNRWRNLFLGTGLYVGPGATDAAVSFGEDASLTGPGTVSNSASGTTVTGVSTLFTKYFIVGDPITVAAETQTVTSIASDTSMTTTTWTGANSGAHYTVTNSGNGYVQYPSGAIGVGGAVPLNTALVNAGRPLGDLGAGSVFGFRSAPITNGTKAASTGALYGFVASPSVGATNSQNLTNLIGMRSSPVITSGATGTIAVETAFYAVSWGNSAAGATITNAYGLKINSPSRTGTISNLAYINLGGSVANTGDYALFDTTGLPTALFANTAPPAGGNNGAGLYFSNVSTFGMFFGTGAPTFSAAQGSIYLRRDGSSVNNRLYVNTDGATTWTFVTTGL